MEQLNKEINEIEINGKVYSINGDSCFVRYSANADGSDFTEEWHEGQGYIGIATAQEPPTDKSGYVWSRCGKDYVLTDADRSKISEQAVSFIKVVDNQLLIRQIGKPSEKGYGKDFANLEIGKEYKAIQGDVSYTDQEFSLVVGIEGVEYVNIVRSMNDTVSSFTFKVLGMENGIISYEYNGELCTLDITFLLNEDQYQNKILDAFVESWYGEVYRSINIKGKDGQTPEKGIDYFTPEEVEEIIKEVVKTVTTARTETVTISADKWTGTKSPYAQVVTVKGVTKKSQVDLTPNVAQLTVFHEKDLAFVTHNTKGVVTVYAVGQKPENDYEMQVTLTEVETNEETIIGVTVGTPISPSKIDEKINPVKTVNGIEPDENGNVEIEIPEGANGKTPYIKDGNWWIGETDTGVKAEGKDGKDGVTISSILKYDDVTAICFSNGDVVDIKNGKDGADGAKGDTYTLTPSDKTKIAEEVVELIDGVPSYWQTHLAERVEDIRRAMESAGRNKSSFFFYSDSHWSNDNTYTAKLAPTLLKYLYKNTPINKTNYGGDIVSAESTDTDIMAYLWDWRTQLRGLPNHHSVIGNHDDGNSTDRLLSKEYIYSYLFAPEESNDIVWGGDFYYYIDDKSEETRYLYLDIFYDRVSEAQTTFVSEALKSTPADWHIVAICHAWFNVDYGTYPPVLNGFDTKAKILLDMFDNYNARGGEFGLCEGWVELCVGGHYHLDHYDHTDGGIPIIIVEADTFHDRGGTMPTHGNIGEASISAVVIDYNDNVVKVIRVGRGNSYEVPINFSKVSYTNVIPLSVGTDGEIFNSGKGWSANSRIGSSGIYLGDQTGDKAQWVTGHIEINPNVDNTFRLKNIIFNKDTTNTYHGIAAFDNSFARVQLIVDGNSTDDWVIPSELYWHSYVYDGNGDITEFTFTAEKLNKNIKYIAFCTGYIGDDSIITINEPIE